MAWLTHRLPFEPKGWQVDLRSELAAAVARLIVKPGEVVHAVLVCEDRSAFDAENVLFYNLGQRAFASIADHGLRFERLHAAPPPCPVALESDPRYFHLYTPAPVDAGYLHWSPAGRVASWQDATCGSRVADLSLASVWHAVKRTAVTIDTDATASGPLAMRLVLSGSMPCRLAGCIKSLLDGAISALHSHDGRANDVVVPRLAAQLGLPDEDVEALLMDRSREVMGRIRLLAPSGSGVQWYPRDDLLVAGELRRKSSHVSRGWMLSGELVKVRAGTAGPTCPHMLAERDC